MIRCDCPYNFNYLELTVTDFIRRYHLPLHENTLRNWCDKNDMQIHGEVYNTQRKIRCCPHNEIVFHRQKITETPKPTKTTAYQR